MRTRKRRRLELLRKQFPRRRPTSPRKSLEREARRKLALERKSQPQKLQGNLQERLQRMETMSSRRILIVTASCLCLTLMTRRMPRSLPARVPRVPRVQQRKPYPRRRPKSRRRRMMRMSLKKMMAPRSPQRLAERRRLLCLRLVLSSTMILSLLSLSIIALRSL
eukprot:Mycagemm_TRINITY_DN10384_c4_g2::TRINITY_DN10384_c4_g2_i1::g.653::m.653 type:complete len:165 gc:universal TRINITY_DN10384_c4_g2_i1:214-708(+)